MGKTLVETITSNENFFVVFKNTEVFALAMFGANEVAKTVYAEEILGYLIDTDIEKMTFTADVLDTEDARELWDRLQRRNFERYETLEACLMATRSEQVVYKVKNSKTQKFATGKRIRAKEYEGDKFGRWEMEYNDVGRSWSDKNSLQRHLNYYKNVYNKYEIEISKYIKIEDIKAEEL